MPREHTTLEQQSILLKNFRENENYSFYSFISILRNELSKYAFFNNSMFSL